MTGRRTTHGRVPPRRTERGQALPTVVAAVSVLTVLAALVAFALGAGTGPSGTSPAAESSPATPSTGEPEKPTSEPTSQQPTSKQSQPKQAKQAKANDDSRQQRSREREPATPDVYVEVYNNSGITRLAASTAAKLRDGGWNVVGVDNWHGDIPASTVYHPQRMTKQARQLAKDLNIDRVRGAVSPMKFDRLTVILTADAA